MRADCIRTPGNQSVEREWTNDDWICRKDCGLEAVLHRILGRAGAGAGRLYGAAVGDGTWTVRCGRICGTGRTGACARSRGGRGTDRLSRDGTHAFAGRRRGQGAGDAVRGACAHRHELDVGVRRDRRVDARHFPHDAEPDGRVPGVHVLAVAGFRVPDRRGARPRHAGGDPPARTGGALGGHGVDLGRDGQEHAVGREPRAAHPVHEALPRRAVRPRAGVAGPRLRARYLRAQRERAGNPGEGRREALLPLPRLRGAPPVPLALGVGGGGRGVSGAAVVQRDDRRGNRGARAGVLRETWDEHGAESLRRGRPRWRADAAGHRAASGHGGVAGVPDDQVRHVHRVFPQGRRDRGDAADRRPRAEFHLHGMLHDADAHQSRKPDRRGANGRRGAVRSGRGGLSGRAVPARGVRGGLAEDPVQPFPRHPAGVRHHRDARVRDGSIPGGRRCGGPRDGEGTARHRREGGYGKPACREDGMCGTEDGAARGVLRRCGRRLRRGGLCRASAGARPRTRTHSALP